MWNTTMLPVGICMSGEAPRGSTDKAHFISICRYSSCDDDHDLPSAHNYECVVTAAQTFVTDGCYKTYVPWPKLTGPAALALAILGAIAAVIAIMSAAWGLFKHLRKRKARRAAHVSVVNEVPLVEGPAVRAESAEPGFS